MFKNLNSLEKEMYNVLIDIKNSDNVHTVLNELDTNSSNALHICIQYGYVENLHESQNADGIYIFASLGNTYINDKGLKFIKSMSTINQVLNCIFNILKGTLGYVLGILTVVIAEVIVWLLTQ